MNFSQWVEEHRNSEPDDTTWAAVLIGALAPGAGRKRSEALAKIGAFVRDDPERSTLFTRFVEDTRQSGWVRLSVALTANLPEAARELKPFLGKLLRAAETGHGARLHVTSAWQELSAFERLKLKEAGSEPLGSNSLIVFDELPEVLQEAARRSDYSPLKLLTSSTVLNKDHVSKLIGQKAELGKYYGPLLLAALRGQFFFLLEDEVKEELREVAKTGACSHQQWSLKFQDESEKLRLLTSEQPEERLIGANHISSSDSNLASELVKTPETAPAVTRVFLNNEEIAEVLLALLENVPEARDVAKHLISRYPMQKLSADPLATKLCDALETHGLLDELAARVTRTISDWHRYADAQDREYLEKIDARILKRILSVPLATDHAQINAIASIYKVSKVTPEKVVLASGTLEEALYTNLGISGVNSDGYARDVAWLSNLSVLALTFLLSRYDSSPLPAAAERVLTDALIEAGTPQAQDVVLEALRFTGGVKYTLNGTDMTLKEYAREVRRISQH